VRYAGDIRSEHVVMSNVKARVNRVGRKHKGSCIEWKTSRGKTISNMKLKSVVDEEFNTTLGSADN